MLNEIYDLFIDLDATEEQLEFPVLYANARTGVAHRELGDPSTDLQPLFEEIVNSIPAPAGDPEGVLQLQVANLDYSDFLGRIAIGRVFNGTIRFGADVAISKLSGELVQTRITKLYTFRGLDRDEVKEVAAGDIVALAGVEGIQIGETITDFEHPAPMPSIPVDEPTIAIVFTVNTSPLAGTEGRYVTSRHVRERLEKELLTNVSIAVEEQDTTDTFRVLGRGELQLAILIETMRREGFEFMVGKPQVVIRQEGGKHLEPRELLVIDCPEGFVGVVIEGLGQRRGEMVKMVNHGSGRVRLEFRIPSRGVIGLRGQLLTDTRGTAIINSIFDGWIDYQGEIAIRPTGSLVADRAGSTTAYALNNIQSRGRLFVGPGTTVYEGMIVGENSRDDDLDVNVTKEKKQTNMRASAADIAIRLIPFHPLNLEQALDFIADDEYIEVTPQSIRLRKNILAANRRPKRWEKSHAAPVPQLQDA